MSIVPAVEYTLLKTIKGSALSHRQPVVAHVLNGPTTVVIAEPSFMRITQTASQFGILLNGESDITGIHLGKAIRDDTRFTFPDATQIKVSVHTALRDMFGSATSETSRDVLLEIIADYLHATDLAIDIVKVGDLWHVIMLVNRINQLGEPVDRERNKPAYSMVVKTYTDMKLPRALRLFAECIPDGCEVAGVVYLHTFDEIEDTGIHLDDYIKLYPSLVEPLTRESKLVRDYRIKAL